MLKAALVLEGGSLRGLYTAGVLDVFIEKNIEFSCVIGVSAGAIVASNYITKQKYRTAKINILHSGDQHYYGLAQLLINRNAFNFDYLFHAPINNIYPYDINALYNTKQKFLICATNCETGKPIYFENKQDYEAMVRYLKASCSVPLLADTVRIDNNVYLDGGISEPIGIKRAIEEKYEKIVVVLTRDASYINSRSAFIRLLLQLKYSKFPNLITAFNNMILNYNNLRSLVDDMEKNNDIFVIRPQKKIEFRHLEKRPRKLIDLYFQGIEDSESNLDKMQKYLAE